MARISMWMGEGCLFSSVSTLMDAFSIANLWSRAIDNTAPAPLFEAEILTLDGNSVEAYGGVRVTPHGSISHVEKSDFIVISPHMPHVGAMPGRLDLLLSWIERLKAGGTPVGTVCTGSFILAEMGLLDGKLATTNWHFANLFRKRYPRVDLKPGLMMTEDDGIICTGAATAVHNLGLHLIETFGSRELAFVCAKALLVDPNRISQAPYMILEPQKNHAAKRLLETSQDSIDEITWAVGYQDTSSFCRLFKQHTDLSPRAYRNKFFQYSHKIFP